MQQVKQQLHFPMLFCPCSNMFDLIFLSADEDFDADQRYITFTANANNSLCQSYTIFGDNVIEEDETFLLSLSSQNPQVSVIGGRDITEVTILNDDCKLICHELIRKRDHVMWFCLPT